MRRVHVEVSDDVRAVVVPSLARTVCTRAETLSVTKDGVL